MTRPALLAGIIGWAASAAGQPVQQIEQPIFFGQRDPASVQLTEGQRLAIGWLHSPGSPGSQFCTGNVIAPGVVLTTRHCFDQALDNVIEFDPIGAEFSVGTGPTDVRATVAVIDSVFHPHRDMVLLKLATPITDRAPVEPLAMIDFPLAESLEGTTAEAAGHGRTEAEAEKVGLFFVAMPITCVDDDFVEVFGGGTRGICSGDSGGPLLVTQPDGTVGILAIEHQGDPNCVGRDYLIRLDRHQDWIRAGVQRLQGGVVVDACGGLTYRGRCVGARVEWCDSNQVLFQECANEGLACGLLDPQQGIFCREAIDCSGTVPSRCSGGMLIGCVEGAPVEVDCVAQGKVCATSATGARCIARCGVGQDDTIDDGAGPFRRPGEAVIYKGVFDINCATRGDGGPPVWLGLLFVWGVARRFRSA